jgi:starch synthase
MLPGTGNERLYRNAGLMRWSGERSKETIHVLFTAAEADPYIKIGGLGDVAGSLPLAIQQTVASMKGLPPMDIRMVLPLHSPIRENFPQLKLMGSYPLESGQVREEVQVFHDGTNLMPVYFLDGEPIRRTQGVYSLDSGLDAEKFVFFSLALLKLGEFLD